MIFLVIFSVFLVLTGPFLIVIIYHVGILKICCHVIVTQQRLIVERFAPYFRNLHLQRKERIK